MYGTCPKCNPMQMLDPMALPRYCVEHYKELEQENASLKSEVARLREQLQTGEHKECPGEKEEKKLQEECPYWNKGQGGYCKVHIKPVEPTEEGS